MGLARAIAIFAAALAIVAAALPCSAAEIGLDIAPAALVKGPQVKLGDIAVVRCDDASAAELSDIVIARAPLPGKSRQVSCEYIKVRLRQHGLDPDAMDAAWPDSVLVTTRSVVIPGADLADAGKETLLSQLPEASRDAGELLVTCQRPPADLVLPEGAVEIEAELLGSFVGASRLVKVTARVDGQRHSSRTICYRVRRFADVVVASRQVSRSEVLGADDLTIEHRELTAAAEPFADTQDLIGLRARRTLRPGEVILRSQVEEPPVIERRQEVWVTVECGAIRVRAQAIACEDAPAGATVRLKNPSTGEAFVGRVDAEGRVFVTP